jgi:hypothetical protein
VALLALALTAAFAVACGTGDAGNEPTLLLDQSDTNAASRSTTQADLTSLAGMAELADLTVARVGHTATVLADGRVLVIGGANAVIGVVASVEIYDPATENWEPADDITTIRVGHTATLLSDGRVLVLGGVGSDGGTPVTEAEFFDPTSGTWSSAGIVLTPRLGHTSTLLEDGRVLVVGEDNLYEPYAELFDPQTGKWLQAGSPAGPRFRHTATLLSDGRVLVAGGVLKADGEPTGSVEIFDPATDTWSTAASLGEPRSRHSAVAIGDGRVMVSSGASTNDDGPGGELASTEIFNPATGEWTTMTLACDARYSHSGSLIADWGDGQVVLIGGQGEKEAANTVISYDPTRNSWSQATGLGLVRVGAAILPMTDGSLMIAGGSLRSSYAVATLREDPEVQTAVVVVSPWDIEWEQCRPFVPGQEAAN